MRSDFIFQEFDLGKGLGFLQNQFVVVFDVAEALVEGKQPFTRFMVVIAYLLP